jgi:hypothetical protein
MSVETMRKINNTKSTAKINTSSIQASNALSIVHLFLSHLRDRLIYAPIFAGLIFLLSLAPINAQAGIYNSNADQDSFIHTCKPDQNDGLLKFIKITEEDMKQDKYRALYRFDLSSVPAGSTIISATANFWVNDVFGGSTYTVNAHRVTSPWTDLGVTWNNINSSYDLVADGSYMLSAANEGTFVSVNITSLVQEWIDNTSPNHGIMLIHDTIEGESRYASKEEPDSSLHPYLQIITASGVSSDIAIDCNLSDWCDGNGNDFCVNDQGGQDDWESPAKLDITRFAFASNLIDTFYVLVAFDDVPPQSTTAATLIDTDLDDNINFVIVTTLDGSNSAVELFSCDDTITYGCSGASLSKRYGPSNFCASDSAGPWNNDSFMEFMFPFSDLGFVGGQAILTSLVSYTSASFLTSPKDSIFGQSDQNYVDRILYDTRDGKGQLTDPAGFTFRIRRDTDPSSIRTALIQANVPQAPFDDWSGSLEDGVSYFYVVEHTGGFTINLSVHANDFDNAVRLGFDDKKPLSAPVDSSLSTVTLDNSSITADGITPAAVKVIPRDANGVPLGSGCKMKVNDLLLAPGMLSSVIQDQGDGSYIFKVVSNNSGVGNVVVTIEGIVLDSQPEITFIDSIPDMASQDLSQDMIISDNMNILNNTKSTNAANSTNVSNSTDSTTAIDYRKTRKVRYHR